jgi:hypothetical protein
VPYTWWLNARANTGDYAFIDPKAYMDVQKMAQCEVHTRNMMNPELGWWGIRSLKYNDCQQENVELTSAFLRRQQETED